jgi:hypothetical protein
MSHRRVLARTARTFAGVVALYGLLLQAYLAAATPTLTPDLWAAICASSDGAAPHAPDKPVRHDHQCCTAAHVGSLAPPPAPAIVAALTPAVTISAVLRPEAAIPRTGPPTHAQSARGPPLA